METDGGGAGQQERNMADDIFNCFKERVTTGPECFPVCQAADVLTVSIGHPQL